jgi:hypothetical protein
MLFKKLKKQSVLQLTAVFLAAVFAIVTGACSGDDVGGTGNAQTETNGQNNGPQTPKATDYDIGNLNQTAGSVIAVTITPKAGKSSGAVTIYYEGTDGTVYDKSQTFPTVKGTYAVTFDVAASDDWLSAAGLSAGILIIGDPDKPTPAVGDYDISGSFDQTAGSVIAITVTPKAGKSGGAVTVYYEGIDETNYAKSATLPVNAGKYAVTFDVAEADGWNAATGLSAGLLIIKAVVEEGETGELEINFISGANAISWGVSSNANVLTLGMTPGDTTKELKINWYSSSGVSGKVTQVRFVRGTFTAGKELIEADGTAAAAGTSNTQHKAAVTGLKPGSSYQYAVSSDGTNWSEIYDFAVPAETGLFKFAVIADPQLTTGNVDKDSRYPATNVTTAAGWKETMGIIMTKGVSFIASGGDQVDTSSNETQYTNLFAPEGIRNLPFAPVVGNHDTNVAFRYHYNLPNEQSFSGTETNVMGNYFYLYNNILFVVLNSASSPNSKSAAATYIDYFRSTIKAAKIAHPKYDWLIIQHHKSTASVADHCADTDIQYYVEAGFETLMSEEDVDFVLAGHDHVYARSYPLKGMDDGKVSLPDKTRGGNEISFSSGDTKNPIYLTFTTGSGLKYYAVSSDPYFKYNNSLYQKNNASYPYLGADANGNATLFGSTSYMAGNLPVSNAAFVQPYIPSYTIVEVNGRTIKFSTYAIASKSGHDSGADSSYSFDKDVPYDWVQVTKN